MDEHMNASETETRQQDASPPDAAEVRHGLVGMVRTGDAKLEQSAVMLTTARGGADLNQSASMAVVSGGDTSIKMTGAVAVPTLGDVHMEMAGAQWVVAAGDVTIDRGGCAVAVAPTVRVDRGGVGVAFGRHVQVGEGGRVLFGPLAAVALGLAFGAGAGLIMAVSAGIAARQALKRLPHIPFVS
jgi:hypothetical protein